MHYRPALLFKFLFLFLFYHSHGSAGQWQALRSSAPKESKPVVLHSDIYKSRVQLNLEGYFLEETLTSNGRALTVSSPGASPLLEAGAPDLPKFAISLVIPDQGGMQVRILASAYKDFHGIEVAPSKGNLMRTVLPADVPYRYGTPYREDEFWPAGITRLRDPYILRDYRGQTLLLCPFQYNPFTKTLRVYTSLTVELEHRASQPSVNELIRSGPLTQMDASYAAIYKGHFANFPSLAYTPLSEGGKLLIICPSNWIPLMQPLVDWKIRRGIEVEVVDVISAGGTAANIQSFIASKYLNGGLTFVLLVGDAAQLPTLYAQGGASDPSYGYILGSDSYAEVMVGRFSAESDPDVMTQVQRVLNYEMYPDPSGLWYDRGVVVGSNQGPGDDGEMDWEHALNMRNDLVNFTYGNVSELYDGTHPGTGDAPGDPSSTDLFNLFQSGIGIMTYTGHGSSTACTTTGLANGDVQNMTNTNMLPFIWAVACVNGEFDMPGGPCFAETFLRATHNGVPTGAIATFMSSINQSWNPPMDAQDEMVDILVQSDSSNLKFTFGGLSVSGCMHMNDQYGLSGVEMTDTWHIFGDPTLQVRTATPQLMSVSHPSSMPVGLTSLTVNCNYNGGLVALTMNGQVLATGAVSGGAATLSFAPVGMPDTIFVTVTGFNQIPYLGQVLVIPASGPYVIYQSSTAKDLAGNNDGLVDFAETIDVDLTLHNVGLADAFNVSAVLSTSDSYVTILNNTVNAGNLLSNTSATLVNAFQYQVAADVPDQHMVFFSVDATDGNGGSWTSSFSQLIQAPALAGGILSIDDATGGDADGYLEAGESATVTIRCHNNGHSDAPLSSASISTFSNFLTLTSPLFNAGTIGKQQYVDATFQVSMLNNVALGTSYDITLQLNSGAYLASKTYVATAGIILEDFESNDFSAFNWLNGAVFPWITTSYQPFEGAYCATNGNVSDNESSELLISLTALADDSVTFWYRMSSEQDWDYLRFYIDGVEQGAWSGTGPWMYTGFPLGTGMHVLKFIYEKDSYLSAGMDCAWIDNVRLPVGSQVTGTAQMIRKDGLAIWPNPSEGIFNVSIEGMKDSDLHWSICDVQGKQLRSGNTRAQQGSSSFALETNGLATGMYLLTLESGSTRRIAKIQVR